MIVTSTLRSAFIALFAATSGATLDSAQAGLNRSGWYAGLGFGPSRAVIEPQGEESEIWVTGAAPQYRFGRFLDKWVALGVESRGWFAEVGTAGDELPLQIKGRFGAHIWPLVVTLIPAPAQGSWSGLHLSAGVGPAIANFALAIPDPSDPEGAREIQVRIDEWGWGLFGTAGYEFPVSRSFAAGFQLAINHAAIEEKYLRRVWYGGLEMRFAWYF